MLVLFEVTLNIIVLAGLLMVAALIGYLPRTSVLRKARRTIDRLEKEMLENHAEILSLQKELAGKSNEPSRTPIVPMRENGPDTKKEPDPAVRKKLLSGGSSGKS